MKEPYFTAPGVALHQGDALDILAEMEPESVNMIEVSAEYVELAKRRLTRNE